MPRKKTNSRALRQLAEELVQHLNEDGELPDEECADFVTSLVRQWLTYGNATFLRSELDQIYLVLGKTPLGNPNIVPEVARPGSPGTGTSTRTTCRNSSTS